MKQVPRLIALALVAVSLAYAKVDPKDFTMDIHVSGSSAGKDCSVSGGVNGTSTTCKATQTIKATIDGKKYQLMAETYFSKGVLPTGDYKARMVGKETNKKDMLKRKYEFLMEDGSTRKFKIVREEE